MHHEPALKKGGVELVDWLDLDDDARRMKVEFFSQPQPGI